MSVMGEYNQHNVLMVRKKTAVTSFETGAFDIQMANLYRFMRKILKNITGMSGWEWRCCILITKKRRFLRENGRIFGSVFCIRKNTETGKLLLFTQQKA